MKQTKQLLLGALIACAFPVCSSAATIDLSTMGWVTYGDANSYALNIPSPTYPAGAEVMAGPGQIDVFTKLGLNTQLSNGTPNMDDAYDTPTANPIFGFRMNGNEPNGVQGTWDRTAWWDSTLFALDSKLNLFKNSMVFFFANNETGNSPDLAGWARVELTKTSTNTLLGRFDLTNDPTHQGLVGYGPPPTGGGVALGNPANYTSNGAAPVVSDFIDSGNDVCTTAGGALTPCTIGGLPNPLVDKTYHENLGGDRAAYAIVFPELDAMIRNLVNGGADLNDYAMHVDYRLGVGPEAKSDGSTNPYDPQYGGFPITVDFDKQGDVKSITPYENYATNGGVEKVFIGTQLAPSNPVPEPGTMMLLGMGMLGLAVYGKRRLNSK